ncbi:sensor histidine kinase [Streptococcus merionis]|uniref:histidine kinase n=1 Tax=Streptococcus merionis TaxID=400065 RepID=A0A239SPS0_9STRE|nr:sensor histidine kinase [Streptococcus merionis]SNU87465.1 OmpR family two component system bacitracin resistance sensor histidine kinase [Streptococcus merionis]
MIFKFFRQYQLWFSLYLALAATFLVTFWLYRLPMTIFLNSLLFSGTIFLLVILYAFFCFWKTLRDIQDLDNGSGQPQFSRPLEQAFWDKHNQTLDTLYKEQEVIYQETDHLKNLVKMWSHQIKVPLASLDLMAQTGKLDSRQVTNQIQSMEHYLAILLNYLKLQDKTDDYRFEEFSMRALMTDLVKSYRSQCLSKDLSVHLLGDWQVKSDRKWLHFAVSQLLDNAIKYSHPGGQIKIEITEGSLAISDQGLGILAEDLPRLFEEGFTGFNGHQHHKSTGLGLYMAKRILDELSWSIEITSQIEVGTTVTISKRSN